MERQEDYELHFGYVVKTSKHFQLTMGYLMWDVLTYTAVKAIVFVQSTSSPSPGNSAYFSTYWVRTQ